MPKKDSDVQCNNYRQQSPRVFYEDFKSNLNEVQKPNKDNADTSGTDKYQEHITRSYKYKVICTDDRLNKPVWKHGDKNSVNRFIEQMLEKVEYCKERCKNTFKKRVCHK